MVRAGRAGSGCAGLASDGDEGERGQQSFARPLWPPWLLVAQLPSIPIPHHRGQSTAARPTQCSYSEPPAHRTASPSPRRLDGSIRRRYHHHTPASPSPGSAQARAHSVWRRTPRLSSCLPFRQLDPDLPLIGRVDSFHRCHHSSPPSSSP